jgi:hypothetical protein
MLIPDRWCLYGIKKEHTSIVVIISNVLMMVFCSHLPADNSLIITPLYNLFGKNPRIRTPIGAGSVEWSPLNREKRRCKKILVYITR